MITARCGQLGGQHVRAYDGETGSAAYRRAGRVAGIPNEPHSTPGPVLHNDRTDGVQIKIVGIFQLGEQSRYLPAHVAVQIADQTSLSCQIATVVVVQRSSSP